MTKNCPECGTPLEFQPAAAQLQTGTCPGCQHTILILAAGGPPLVVTAPPAEPAAPGGSDDDSAGEAEGGAKGFSFRCPECGTDTELSVRGRGAIAAECEVCDQTYVFRLQKAPSSEEATEEERPPFRPRGPGFGRDREAPPGRDRARPCRECGGPLRFETNEDGGVTGTCQSCGNTFTLPKRSDDRGRSGGRRYTPYGRGRPGGGRDAGRRPFGGGYGRGGSVRRRRERADDS